MTPREELQSDIEALKKDPLVLFFIGFGIFLIIAGGIALNPTHPNNQIGYPLVAIGFALTAFGLNRFSSIESGLQLMKILTKIQSDIEEIKHGVHLNKTTNCEKKMFKQHKNIKSPLIGGFFILLFIIVILMVYGMYTDTSFIQSQLFAVIIGAIIGALIAFLSSYYLFWAHERNKINAIARGFCVEFKVYKDWLNEWISYIGKLDDVKLQNKNIRLENPFPTSLNRAFFDEDSLYYHFRKEVFEFDEDTSMKIFSFYSCLKGADESRRILLSIFNESWHPLTQKEALLHIKTNFEKAMTLLSELERELGCS
ncbi:MAG: hypothetical protein ACLQMU_02545 [Methanoregula sp.]|uniref:hypothetical protein n=1 Tax=Methanoregula sp. TaxID=2052170 RepID=UPI003FD8C363